MSNWQMSDPQMSYKKMMPFWRENSNSYGGPDGPDLPDGAGAASGHLGGDASIRSSPDGQDEAIDTPTVAFGLLDPKIEQELCALYI